MDLEKARKKATFVYGNNEITEIDKKGVCWEVQKEKRYTF